MKIEKERRSQIPLAILLIVLVALFMLYTGDDKLSLYLMFGIAFGAVLQRSRFCFTAAFRDPIMTRTSSLTDAFFLAMGIGTAGVFILNMIWNSNGKVLRGIDAVYPLSVLTVIGGIIFGIGMVIASGCASGTLVRIGEGMKMQWVSFVLFLLGAILGSGFMGYLDPLFEKSKMTLFLPDYVGWNWAFIIQMSLIAGTYTLIKKIAKRRK